eukprot:TRINITY_DN76513_c0_g1_i1.p1 TRINITY_DN76513_c0_g1~~TRINITY_DN76513_c0_g1_i1.p1  ORF type:complete len:361 (+),score=35.16 TRINITY_DN76513_c0_g1_i1:203-1285(+)
MCDFRPRVTVATSGTMEQRERTPFMVMTNGGTSPAHGRLSPTHGEDTNFNYHRFACHGRSATSSRQGYERFERTWSQCSFCLSWEWDDRRSDTCTNCSRKFVPSSGNLSRSGQRTGHSHAVQEAEGKTSRFDIADDPRLMDMQSPAEGNIQEVFYRNPIQQSGDGNSGDGASEQLTEANPQNFEPTCLVGEAQEVQAQLRKQRQITASLLKKVEASTKSVEAKRRALQQDAEQLQRMHDCLRVESEKQIQLVTRMAQLCDSPADNGETHSGPQDQLEDSGLASTATSLNDLIAFKGRLNQVFSVCMNKDNPDGGVYGKLSDHATSRVDNVSQILQQRRLELERSLDEASPSTPPLDSPRP